MLIIGTMTSNAHTETECTKKFNIPLSHLEFNYITNCNNIKELEKIVRVLRSGSEGKYPDLEACAEAKLQKLDPKSRVLRKDGPILRPGDLSSGDWKQIENDLQNWTSSMNEKETINGKTEHANQENSSAEENLPPVRASNIILEGKKQKKLTDGQKKKVVPRDYKEWDKLDVEAELKKAETEEKSSISKKSVIEDVTVNINETGLSQEEKEIRANREKDKGNEAFRSKDFKESVLYYTRSISLLPTAASYNNRALAYLKLEEWDKAIADCNSVLNLEQSNVKALLRRATGYNSKKEYSKAEIDLNIVITMEPNNKIAKDLLESINSRVHQEILLKKEKGKRLVIEEVEESGEENESSLTQPESITIEQGNELNSDTPKLFPSDVMSFSQQNEDISSSSPPLSSDMTDTSALPSSDVGESDKVPDKSKTSEIKTSLPLTRPRYVQLPLPSDIQHFKENGNTLFRNGQYGHAGDEYSKAISELQKESTQQVNLSILLNNRAACHLKIGHCSQAVEDCTQSLLYVPHNVKALLRRAAAYETLEKYSDAYVDYKHVISIDKSTEQAFQGAHRCQSILQKKLGVDWRQKIPPLVSVQPWEVPLVTDIVDGNKSVPCTLSNLLPTFDLPVEEPKKAEPIKETIYEERPETKTNSVRHLSKTEEFDNLKQLGNDCVQKGHYEEAVTNYSSCIALCPEQTACYTNRALCFLKLKKPTEAAADCSRVLSIQPDNPKALYRRALAHKMMLQYKSSLQDLVELLKLEPKNCAAQKEMDTVKMLYKQELEKLKANKVVEQETKIRKRIKIEEVDEDDDHKISRDKNKAQGKMRNVKSTLQSSNKTKVDHKCHSADCTQPATPPIASRLMKTTPYEFYQAWNSLKASQGIQPYAEILRQVLPVDLPSVISNKLDGQMLQMIVRCVNEEMVAKGEIDLGYQILDNLCQVPRFSTVSMFMNSKEKKEVSTLLDILYRSVSNSYTPADIVRLKKEYSVK
ncbi:Sperm associated antigen 1 [Bulinus truncatus]|nr:Sperm associated antigen 1 [Bulinus truncatus]